MFKSRGRSDDLKNVAVLAQHKELSETIHVRQINIGGDFRSKKGQLANRRSEERSNPGRKKTVRKKPVLVREPLRSMPVSIPYNKEPNWKFSRLTTGGLVNVADLQKKYERIMDVGAGSTPRFSETLLLQKQVENANLEADIGNIQLGKVKQMLQNAKLKKQLYNIEDRPTSVEGRKRFLLTINDVQPRMRKIQFVHFTKVGARFRSAKNLLTLKLPPPKVTEEEEGEEEDKKTEERVASFDTFKTHYEDDGLSDLTSTSHEDFREQIKKSAFLTKELNPKAEKVEEVMRKPSRPFFQRLESLFKDRPFAEANSNPKSYHPLFDPLKNTLYSTGDT